MSDIPPDRRAARILRDARWMVGLTQAEVAQRSGVTRQVIGQYENGARHPSVETLDRLLAGCGIRLRLSLVPEPGLEDEPTRDLLRLPPLARISAEHAATLSTLAAAIPTPESMIVGGKVGARLHGACIRVYEVEVWFSDQQPPAEVAALLTTAGAVDVDYAGVAHPIEFTPSDLREGCPLLLDGVEIRVLAVPHYDGRLRRSGVISLGQQTPTSTTEQVITLAGASECATGWYPRDRDHLALQRAIRLAAEASDPMPGGVERFF